ncbi:hypothetical protein [Paenibacillus terreus]|uniref:hypothetical protein n=1 Tax=Paenibacillus terreus TaxID=1387834 RepID=UPI0035CCFD0F
MTRTGFTIYHYKFPLQSETKKNFTVPARLPQHESAFPAYTLANEPDRGKKRNELH